MRVLVVDDEKLIVKGIRFSLEQDGMEVECAYDGEEALNMIRQEQFDIVLLDLMLPKLSGLEVCQQVREFSKVPIIMITAKGEDMDKIMGLEYGADDYITKPFNILEVKARIKAVIRRLGNEKQESAKTESVLEISDMRLETEDRRLYIAGKEINLTSKEFDVLELLVRNPNKVYSREKLLELAEEEPELSVSWNEALKSIECKVMGEIQLEVLKTVIRERFGSGFCRLFFFAF